MIREVLLRDAARAQWRCYRDPIDVLVATQPDAVSTVLAAVEAAVHQHGCWAAGFVSYEAAAGLDPALVTPPCAEFPLVMFGLFRSMSSCACPIDDHPVKSLVWQRSSHRRQYEEDISAIRQLIAAGDVYQINHTLRQQASFAGDASLWRGFGAQSTYGAWFDTDDFAIACASPELFFARKGRLLTCQPMKGTADRGLWSQKDREQRCWLQGSSKNRAENLMITDMVRNDLGRIAEPGSVQVTELFGLHRLPTVWQMTSTVTAESQADIVSIFRALFPAASITGAPKCASMEAIAAREQTRDIYTGSIGFIDPDGSAQFNVAIRTALIDRQRQQVTYGVGGGIVWDSEPSEEWAELDSKARVLEARAPTDFALFETMRLTVSTTDWAVQWLDQHLARLAASAEYFGFDWLPQRAYDAISAAVTGYSADQYRLRLTLHSSGKCDVAIQPLPKSVSIQPLCLAAEPVHSDDVRLYHKTTDRRLYDQAATSVPVGCEALLFNQDGYITESTIANVVYEIDGRRFTPPLAHGVLNGIARQQLVTSGAVLERPLPLSQVDQVSDWFLVNALRGERRAVLTHAASDVLAL